MLEMLGCWECCDAEDAEDAGILGCWDVGDPGMLDAGTLGVLGC